MTPLTACKLTSHLTCHRFAVLGGDTRMRYVAERLSEAGCPVVLCGCGGKGCLEAEASGSAIAAKYLDLTGEPLSAKEIARKAKEGDRISTALYREAGYLIGSAIASAANILNPELAVLGGGVSMDLPLLAPGIERALEEGLFSAANPEFKIVKTGLGYNAALLGAAALAL